MLKVVGMQELVDKLDKMSVAGQKISTKTLNKAGNIVKKAEIQRAKKHNKYSQNVGWKEIKKFSVKRNKNGARVVDIGIKGSVTKSQKRKDLEAQKRGDSRPTQWDRIRGLYFNNYGFYHNITGEYIAGSDWFGKAYEDSADEAYGVIRQELLKELDL